MSSHNRCSKRACSSLSGFDGSGIDCRDGELGCDGIEFHSLLSMGKFMLSVTESLCDLFICNDASGGICPCGAVLDRVKGIAVPRYSLGIRLLLLLRI